MRQRACGRACPLMTSVRNSRWFFSFSVRKVSRCMRSFSASSSSVWIQPWLRARPGSLLYLSHAMMRRTAAPTSSSICIQPWLCTRSGSLPRLAHTVMHQHCSTHLTTWPRALYTSDMHRASNTCTKRRAPMRQARATHARTEQQACQRAQGAVRRACALALHGAQRAHVAEHAAHHAGHACARFSVKHTRVCVHDLHTPVADTLRRIHCDCVRASQGARCRGHGSQATYRHTCSTG
jgi:hypothetical protein